MLLIIVSVVNPPTESSHMWIMTSFLRRMRYTLYYLHLIEFFIRLVARLAKRLEKSIKDGTVENTGNSCPFWLYFPGRDFLGNTAWEILCQPCPVILLEHLRRAVDQAASTKVVCPLTRTILTRPAPNLVTMLIGIISRSS